MTTLLLSDGFSSVHRKWTYPSSMASPEPGPKLIYGRVTANDIPVCKQNGLKLVSSGWLFTPLAQWIFLNKIGAKPGCANMGVCFAESSGTRANRFRVPGSKHSHISLTHVGQCKDQIRALYWLPFVGKQKGYTPCPCFRNPHKFQRQCTVVSPQNLMARDPFKHAYVKLNLHVCNCACPRENRNHMRMR